MAGAGSGKTRVLTHRIAYLVATGAVQPSEILAITFTNKAASEMRKRAELLVGRRVRAMWIMTFHSACARMLRAHADKLGYTRQFTIYDQADSRRLIKRCLEENGVDPKRFTPAAIHNQISDSKNHLRDAQAYAQMVGSFFEQTVADVFASYERELHRMNAMDFDDLLVRAVNVLELFPEVREAYQEAFRRILVDEYQDTNHAQYRWLQLLSGERRNLTVVGDPDQSIYSFRGADIHNILSFEDEFPDAKVVKLEQNYRSTQTILDAANAVIAGNRGRKEKLLWTEVGQGDPIKVRELDDEHAEARFVTGEVQRLIDEGMSRREVAIFYRTNAQSRVLEDTLVRADVAYQVVGGTKFYERAEIKDAIAYLTALVNPQDAGAFTRIVNSPRRGIGATSIGRVLGFANTMGISIWEAAAEPSQVPGLGAAAIKAIGRFMGTMTVLKERMEGGAAVSKLLGELLEQSDYLEALRAERASSRGSGADRGTSRNSVLNVCAAEYDASDTEQPSVAEFLQQIALVADADTRVDDDGLVTLMTLHNAKGSRVIRVVFMIGLEDGVFPHSRAIEEGAIEEERRLCYVGITRAERDLYLTHARSRTVFGSHGYAVPSRFLMEIPADLTDIAEQRSRVPGAGASARSAAGAIRERLISWPSAEPEGEVAAYRLGDDVVHPKWGEGVVTGLEPGGIVVIRFSAEASERKLIADLAPITKRS